MNPLLKILLPILVLALGAGVAKQLIDRREIPEPEERQVVLPIVRTLRAQATDWRVVVPSRGTVVPLTETQLVVEVGGRVTHVSPQLVNGGFFETGELLLEIDPRDHELARAQSRLEVARAERRLAEEEADSAVARAEWERLGEGEASALALREPQVAEARATLVAAQAHLERAERDIERTRISAPFDGRVRSESVDVGQYVSPGTPVATVYATDVAEVRLPLSDGELAFLELPFGARGDESGELPAVLLSADFAGRRRTWPARIVRTEGEIDPSTRMVMAVARVEDPYGRAGGTEMPLALGMFVDARLQGILLHDVFVLPRTALRDGARIFLLDGEDRLRFLPVEILRSEREVVIVRAALSEGARVVVSPLEIATDGMRVRDVGGDVGLRPAGESDSAEEDASGKAAR
jgi:RND family efflux transporter MFP subunit